MTDLEAKIRCLELAAKLAVGGENPIETVAKAGRTLYDSLYEISPAPKTGTLTVPKKDK